MQSKKSFLKKIKERVREKTVRERNFVNDFCISEKQIEYFIKEIFDYLNLNDVYVNVHDLNLDDTLIKDLDEMIMGYLSYDDSYIFLNNFKSSIRQIQNDEREKLMKFHDMIDFNKYENILGRINKNCSNRGRPTIQ